MLALARFMCRQINELHAQAHERRGEEGEVGVVATPARAAAAAPLARQAPMLRSRTCVRSDTAVSIQCVYVQNGWFHCCYCAMCRASLLLVRYVQSPGPILTTATVSQVRYFHSHVRYLFFPPSEI